MQSRDGESQRPGASKLARAALFLASKDGDFTFGVRSNGLLGAGAAAEFLVERTRDIGFGTGPVDGPHRVH